MTSTPPPPHDPDGVPGDQPQGTPPPGGQQPYGQESYGQQSYGQQSYGQGAPPPPGGSYDPAYAHHPGGQPQQLGKGMAITALVLGIVGLVLCVTIIGIVLGGPLGLVALVLGIIGASRAKKGRAAGRGMAITGAVLGALCVLATILVIALGAAFWQSSGGADLQECLSNAGDDAAAVEQCNQEFEDQVNNQFGS